MIPRHRRAWAEGYMPERIQACISSGGRLRVMLVVSISAAAQESGNLGLHASQVGAAEAAGGLQGRGQGARWHPSLSIPITES